MRTVKAVHADASPTCIKAEELKQLVLDSARTEGLDQALVYDKQGFFLNYQSCKACLVKNKNIKVEMSIIAPLCRERSCALATCSPAIQTSGQYTFWLCLVESLVTLRTAGRTRRRAVEEGQRL